MATANNQGVLGFDARHGDLGQKAYQNAIPLVEAQDIVLGATRPFISERAKLARTPLMDRGGCSIVRQTERGNELSFLFNRRGNLMLVLRLQGGLVRLHNRQATVSATPWRTAGDRAVPVETAASTLVVVHADSSHEPLVYGRLDPAFLGKLDDPRWNTVALSLYDDAGVSLADRTDTAGMQVAVAALERCEQSLPG